MPSLDGLLVVAAVAFAAPFLLGLAPGLRDPRGRAGARGRHRRRPVRARVGRARPDARGHGRARPRLPALHRRAGGRLRAAARPRAARDRLGLRDLARARAARRARALRGRPRPDAAAGRGRAGRDVARRPDPGAQGRGPQRRAAGAARHRRRLDRRLRRDRAPHAALRGRGRPGRDGRARRRAASRSRRPSSLVVRGAERSMRIRADLLRAAGHDGADPGPRGGGAARRVRGRGTPSRPGGDPRARSRRARCSRSPTRTRR